MSYAYKCCSGEPIQNQANKIKIDEQGLNIIHACLGNSLNGMWYFSLILFDY